MKIEKNSRQIPKKESIVSNKNYCDLVYSWFQCESVRLDESEERQVAFGQVNYSAMSKVLGMDRRVVSKYVNKLCEMGLLEKDDFHNVYVVKTLDKDSAALVPYVTLREIQNTLHRNSVSIYVHLLNEWFKHGMKEFTITYNELKAFIGIATTTSANNIVVKDILKVLGLLHLVTSVEIDENKMISIVNVSNCIG